MKKQKIRVHASWVFACILLLSMLGMQTVAFASQSLICDRVEHTHTEDCYGMQRTLLCEQGHTDDVFNSDDVFTENIFEGVLGHVHTEECYGPEESILICGVEEHTHSGECYTIHDVQDIFVSDAPEKDVFAVPQEMQPIEDHTPSNEVTTPSADVSSPDEEELSISGEQLHLYSAAMCEHIMEIVTEISDENPSITDGTGILHLGVKYPGIPGGFGPTPSVYRVTWELNGYKELNVYALAGEDVEEYIEVYIPDGASVKVELAYYNASFIYCNSVEDAKELYDKLTTYNQYNKGILPEAITIDSFDETKDYTVCSILAYRGILTVNVALTNYFESVEPELSYVAMLPETGGVGAAIYILTGGIIFVIAIVAIEGRRRYAAGR